MRVPCTVTAPRHLQHMLSGYICCSQTWATWDMGMAFRSLLFPFISNLPSFRDSLSSKLASILTWHISFTTSSGFRSPSFSDQLLFSILLMALLKTNQDPKWIFYQCPDVSNVKYAPLWHVTVSWHDVTKTASSDTAAPSQWQMSQTLIKSTNCGVTFRMKYLYRQNMSPCFPPLPQNWIFLAIFSLYYLHTYHCFLRHNLDTFYQ